MFAEREDHQELNTAELLRLARNRSSAGRMQLTEIVSDLFFNTTRVLTDQERAAMTDILRQLIHDVEISVRKHLAIRLSDEPDAPSELVNILANDVAEIALPVLTRSQVLQDPELVEIIRHRTLEHQLAIAMRAKVSPVVCDALVETENETVIESLLKNQGAEIAQETMSYLVEQSQRVDAFQNPLVRRQDLPENLAKRMYWWVSAALRTEILEKHDLDPNQLDDVMESAVQAAVRSDDTAQKPASAANVLVRRLLTKHGCSAELLIRLLKAGEISLFEQVLEQGADLRGSLVKRLIYEPGGEGMAILCRAKGYAAEDFMMLLSLCRKARPETGENYPIERISPEIVYGRIKQEAAQNVLERWRRNPDYLDLLRQVEDLAPHIF